MSPFCVRFRAVSGVNLEALGQAQCPDSSEEVELRHDVAVFLQTAVEWFEDLVLSAWHVIPVLFGMVSEKPR